jgi:rod shape-determining protein MreC
MNTQIRDWAVLAFLLLISLVVTLNRNAEVTRSLRAISLQITSGLESQFARTGEFVRALDENGEIRDQNIRLSSQLARLREAELENERLRALLALRDTLDAPTLAVRIVTRDIHRQKNFIVIDAGSDENIRRDMALIDDKGILGKVVLTGNRYSVVQSYLNTDFRVPGLVLPIEAFGIVRWDGVRLDQLVLDYVVRTERVEPGQLVVTAGSEIFPSGIPIGTIDSVAVRPGENLLQITIKPTSRLGSARNAFVVMRSPDEELERLKDQSETP